jgi:hypothetical protein
LEGRGQLHVCTVLPLARLSLKPGFIASSDEDNMLPFLPRSYSIIFFGMRAFTARIFSMLNEELVDFGLDQPLPIPPVYYPKIIKVDID